jgi:hypothetical protein
MLLSEQAKTANPEAMAAVTEALLRIWLADASGNNGTVNGESVLCRAHSMAAAEALERAGLTLPDYGRKR